jgi:hypothetical protein
VRSWRQQSRSQNKCGAATASGTNKIYPAGEIAAASVSAPKAFHICIAGEVTVAAKDRGAIVILGKNDNICLVISNACQKVAFALARIVGRAKIGIAVAGIQLQPAKFVLEKDIENAADCVRSVNSGSAIFQNVDVIDDRERNQV